MATKKADPADAAQVGEDTIAAAAAAPVPALRILGPAKGFRRAGMQFGAAPVTIPLADLTAGQIAALRAEPMLIVADVTL